MPLSHLISNNRRWAERKRAEDPEYFSRLASQQNPEYLWIGCSDSRVPANQITGLAPGEVFVHRNVSNVVVHSDLNCLSVIHYAVEVLKVRHIMVVGHYGCGGIRAALEDRSHGLIDNWLRHVQDVAYKYRDIMALTPAEEQVNRLCELNVIDQVANVCNTTLVRNAWEHGQELSVHGWVYGLEDGLLREMRRGASSQAEAVSIHDLTIQQLSSRL